MRPPGPYRLPGPGRSGVVRRRAGGLARVLHLEDEPVVVHARPVAGAVRLRSEAGSRAAAAYGIERMSFALCLEQDLRPFHRRFRRDRLMRAVIVRRPWIRPHRFAEPFEALAFAITEQLIESRRAEGIQRRLVWRYGRRSPCGRLRDAPSAAALAGRSPAELEACDLSARRAIAVVRAARAVASGRIDLREEEPAWQRLLAIPTIGRWTQEKLAFHGQGRDDQLPAGDLAYLKLVGRLERLGRRASEEEVRRFFAPYAPFQALAGLHLLHAAGSLLRDAPPPWVSARETTPRAA